MYAGKRPCVTCMDSWGTNLPVVPWELGGDQTTMQGVRCANDTCMDCCSPPCPYDPWQQQNGPRNVYYGQPLPIIPSPLPVYSQVDNCVCTEVQGTPEQVMR